MASVEARLRSWEQVLEHGGPDWLTRHAPRIVTELRDELARRDARLPEPPQ